MRVLIVTKIFPNRHVPSEAAYNRLQFGALAHLCDVEMVALLPRFPGDGLVARLRGAPPPPSIPRHDVVDELDVEYADVLYLPKVGAPIAGATYAASLLPRVWPRRGRIDVVLGSFAYPDGWAAVMLARLMGCPAVVKLHGSDINVVSQSRWLRPGLRQALQGAARVVGNSRQLLNKAVRCGADPLGTRLVINGVDKKLFRLQPRLDARRALGLPLEGRRVLFIGRVSTPKGVWELLDACEQLAAEMPDVQLDLVGPGDEREAVERAVQQRGLPVHLYGRQQRRDVALHIAAADLVTLPSHNEGTPNALLEALSCGRPVVASDVGGIPDLIHHRAQGEIVPAREAGALAAALARVLAANYPPEDVAAASPFPSWEQSAAALHQVLCEARGAATQAAAS